QKRRQLLPLVPAVGDRFTCLALGCRSGSLLLEPLPVSLHHRLAVGLACCFSFFGRSLGPAPLKGKQFVAKGKPLNGYRVRIVPGFRWCSFERFVEFSARMGPAT